MIDMLYANMLH